MHDTTFSRDQGRPRGRGRCSGSPPPGPRSPRPDPAVAGTRPGDTCVTIIGQYQGVLGGADISPVHELDAVVQVGHTGHAHGLGQPVPGVQLHVEEAPELCRVSRLACFAVLTTNKINNQQEDKAFLTS